MSIITLRVGGDEKYCRDEHGFCGMCSYDKGCFSCAIFGALLPAHLMQYPDTVTPIRHQRCIEAGDVRGDDCKYHDREMCKKHKGSSCPRYMRPCNDFEF